MVSLVSAKENKFILSTKFDSDMHNIASHYENYVDTMAILSFDEAYCTIYVRHTREK